MKNVNNTSGLLCIFFVMVMVFFSENSLAFAGDTPGSWRTIYDLVMRWLNFIILSFIIVKISRSPLKKFLREKQEAIGRDIQNLEAEREKANDKNKALREQLIDSKSRLEGIKQKIIYQGEKKKRAIIENARLESRMMLEEAKRKLDGQIFKARRTIKSEMVDLAIDLAIGKLPERITREDSRRLNDQYLKIADSG